MRGIACLLLTSGCGVMFGAITPDDVKHYEVTRMTSLQVTTSPAPAAVYVDGAESGTTPRAISVPYKEIRRHHHKSSTPAVIGTVLDVLACSIATAVAADHGKAWIAGGASLGVIVLDVVTIGGHENTDRVIEIQPIPTEVGVRAPGFEDASRRVRVPDALKLHFVLVPKPEPSALRSAQTDR
jgi:hypothetical protein